MVQAIKKLFQSSRKAEPPCNIAEGLLADAKEVSVGPPPPCDPKYTSQVQQGLLRIPLATFPAKAGGVKLHDNNKGATHSPHTAGQAANQRARSAPATPLIFKLPPTVGAADTPKRQQRSPADVDTTNEGRASANRASRACNGPAVAPAPAPPAIVDMPCNIHELRHYDSQLQHVTPQCLTPVQSKQPVLCYRPSAARVMDKGFKETKDNPYLNIINEDTATNGLCAITNPSKIEMVTFNSLPGPHQTAVEALCVQLRMPVGQRMPSMYTKEFSVLTYAYKANKNLHIPCACVAVGDVRDKHAELVFYTIAPCKVDKQSRFCLLRLSTFADMVRYMHGATAEQVLDKKVGRPHAKAWFYYLHLDEDQQEVLKPCWPYPRTTTPEQQQQQMDTSDDENGSWHEQGYAVTHDSMMNFMQYLQREGLQLRDVSGYLNKCGLRAILIQVFGVEDVQNAVVKAFTFLVHRWLSKQIAEEAALPLEARTWCLHIASSIRADLGDEVAVRAAVEQHMDGLVNADGSVGHAQTTFIDVAALIRILEPMEQRRIILRVHSPPGVVHNPCPGDQDNHNGSNYPNPPCVVELANVWAAWCSAVTSGPGGVQAAASLGNDGQLNHFMIVGKADDSQSESDASPAKRHKRNM